MTSTTVPAGTLTTIPAGLGPLNRLVVPIGVVCSITHLVLAPVHGVDHPAVGILTVAAAVFCLFHLAHLGRVPTVHGWWSTGALGALMSVHSPVLDALAGSGGATQHLPLPGTGHHSASTPLQAFSLESLVTVGTLAGAVQTVLCLVVVLRLRRHAGPPVPRSP